MMDDPKRLLDEGPADLRALLDAGRSEAPTDAQLAALALKLGVLAGAAGGGGAAAAGGGATATAAAATNAAKAGAAAGLGKGLAAGLATKVTAAVVAASIATGAGVYMTKRATPPTAVTTPTPTPTPTPIANPTPNPIPIPTPIPTPTPTPTPSPILNPPPPRNPSDDFALVDRAQRALSSSPAQALALCNEHARAFPRGEFAQEREITAIDALVRLGRGGEARERARRFRAAYPGAAGQRRVDQLVPPDR